MLNESSLESCSDKFPRTCSLGSHRQDWLEKQPPYYNVLLIPWEVSILTPDWLRTTLCWVVLYNEDYFDFILTASQLVSVFLFVVSKYLFSCKTPDMNISLLAHLISTLGQMLIKVLLFLMNMGEYMGTQRRGPEFFYFITCTVHSLLSRASVQFQLLPGRERVFRRVSQLTPLRGRDGGGFESCWAGALKIT